MALDGKTALITGSSRGIGRGIALALADSGVKVAVHYFQNEGATKKRSSKSANAVPTVSLCKQM